MKKVNYSNQIIYGCLLCISLLFPSTTIAQNTAPVNPPAGGFRIEGDLQANTPALGVGDWIPGPAGSGGYVMTSAGVVLNPTRTFHFIDAYGSGDDVFTSGHRDDDPNDPTKWKWGIGSANNKTDINNALLHFTTNTSNNHTWAIFAADRASNSGTSYLDFEFLQGTLTKNANGTFTSSGPNGGRTVNDLLFAVEYTGGGGNATIGYYSWQLSGGVYKYVSYTPAAGSAYGFTSAGGESVPYGAFGSTTYASNQFVEGAFDLDAAIGAVTSCSGIAVKTFLVKTKPAVQDVQLTDFVTPLQIDLSIGYVATIGSQTNVNCNGGNNGNVVITVNGGVSPFTYVWSPSVGTGATASNLTVGSYTVTVTDNRPCTTSTIVTITQPTALTSVLSGDNVHCNGQANGSVTAFPAGGTSPYTYSWSPGGQTGQTATGLGPNTYSVTISDSHGCTTISSLAITQPATLTASVSGTNVRCNGQNNGVVMVTASGGNVGGYSYVWTPIGATTQTVSNLTPNTYTVTVTDTRGCTAVQTIQITQPAVISIGAFTDPVNCNGQNNGEAWVTVSGGTPSYTYQWSPSGQTNQTATGLIAGNYTVTVTDANSCSAIKNVVVTQPVILTASASSANVRCNGESNGVAWVSPTGGNGGYSYTWTPGGASTQTVSSLGPNTYTITLSDSQGCTTTSTVTITQPPALTATPSSSPVRCNGESNGVVWVVAGGGNGGYTYSWSPGGQATTTVSSLSASTYTITVTDSRGCTAVQTIAVTQPAVLAAPSSSTPVSCNGQNNGTAWVTPSGGNGSYTYAWTPGGQTTQTATGLSPTTYTITVTDSKGCTATSTVVITQPSTLTAPLSSSAVRCNGENNGVAWVIPAGGNGGYTYSWTPSGQTTQTASNLSPTTYTITVTDALGCSLVQTVAITEPAILTAPTSSTPVRCNGENNGVAWVTPSGGNGSYTYAWTPTSATTQTISNLPPNTYTITVTDARGCTATQTVTITQPPGLTATISNTDVNCNGGNNAIAIANPSGGNGGYSYLWSPTGQIGQTATNLTVGNYTVTVTDSKGCTTTQVVTITEPTLLTASVTSSTNVSCNGACNGTAVVTASGGTLGYTYSWSPGGQTGLTATSLCAGSYAVLVTDAHGCTVITQVVTISQPAVLSASASVSNNVSCNGGNDATASVIVSGGTLNYTYSWSPGGQTTQTATGLSQGCYTVNVTDANGCTTSQTACVTQPNVLSSTVSTQVNVSCNSGSDAYAIILAAGGTPGYTYSWSPSGGTDATATNLSAGNYTVLISDDNGCTHIQTLTITEPPALNPQTFSTNSTCTFSNGTAWVTVTGGTGSYTYLWSASGQTVQTATNLAAGTYTVTVTDANGCTAIEAVNVVDAGGPTVTTSINADVLCNGNTTGSATANVTGGTLPLTYSWSPSGGSGATATGLPAGTYNVTVTDSNGCVSIANVTITEPPQLTSIISSTTNVSCNGNGDGIAVVTAGGGAPGYTYSWSPSGGTDATATGLSPNTYSVTVTDLNGCSTVSTVSITEPVTLTAAIDSVHNVGCHGESSGTIVASASGGTLGYTYLWSPTGDTIPNLIHVLPAGTYTLTVTDNNGCIATVTQIITEPDTIVPLIDAINLNGFEIACFGDSSGIAYVDTVFGGTGPFTYIWSTTDTTDTIYGLRPGQYSITVYDANGCSADTFLTLTQPLPVTSQVSSANVTCSNDCDGFIVIDSVFGGVGGYSYSWSPFASTADSIGGLCAGTYRVIISDLNGCNDTVITTITQPSPITISASVNDISCHGDSTGSITAIGLGGTGSIYYLWLPTLDTTATIDSLTAGSYTVYVSDDNGCLDSATYTITEPPAITAATSTTAVICNGDSTGTAIIVASGGVPGYSYLWTPSGQTSTTATALLIGTYTVLVTDANNCTYTTTVTITQPTAVTATLSETDVLCNGSNSGTAIVVASGGVGGYTYSWSPSGGTDATATGLGQGTYTVLVTDANGCTYTDTITVNQPATLAGSASETNVLCNGGNSGTAIVTVSGGLGAYTYSWTPSGGTDATATGLGQGTYTVSVTDANGCTFVDTVVVTEPTALNATLSTTAVICNGGSTGTAWVSASGGTPGYTYLWNPSGQTTDTATGLGQGTYTVLVTDANGCTFTNTITVTEPTALTGVLDYTPALCNGGGTGTAWVNPAGGTGAYTYVWNPTAQSTQTATGLLQGTYSVLVTDANGCTFVDSVTVTEASSITAITNTTDALCNSSATGTAWANPTGGNPAYTYLWTPSGQTTDTATGLSAGTYTVLITDANGCTLSTTVNVTEPAAVNGATFTTDALCNGDANGLAFVLVSGGTGAYSYLWTPSGQTGQTATGLPANTYTIVVTDANGCTFQTTATITEPSVLDVQTATIGVKCYGDANGHASAFASGGTANYNYFWTPGNQVGQFANGLSAGTYTVTVTDVNGCTVTNTATVTQPQPVNLSVSSSSPLCNGGTDGSAIAIVFGGVGTYTYSWSPTSQTTQTATGLSGAVPYTVVVTDSNNCSASTTFTMAQPQPITTNAGLDQAICGDTTQLNAVLNPGETGSWSTILGTGLATSFGSPTSGVTGLTFGNNTLLWTIVDANGCRATDQVDILADQPVQADIGTGNIDTCLDDFNQMQFILYGSAGNGNWLANPGNQGGFTNSTSPITQYSNPIPGDNILIWTVTSTNFLCRASDSVLVHIKDESECGDIVLPTGYTPNGDGYNDSYVIHGIGAYPDNTFVVFNRWGNEVYHKDDYKNNGDAADWHGQNNKGEPLPAGTYYVILTIKNSHLFLNTYVDLRK
jgi:gliding motility-associated-like protein